jgi:hypothetical protein
MHTLQIKNAGIQKVTAHEIKALGTIEFGPASVDAAKAKKLALHIFPRELALRGVSAAVDLHCDLEVGVKARINLGFRTVKWENSQTVSVPLTFSLPTLPDLVITRDLSSSDRLSLLLDEVGLGKLTAALDSIVGSQLGALVKGAVMENVAADRIELPVGEFPLEGLGLGSMEVRKLGLKGLHVDKATIGTVSGALPLPRLVLKNFKIGRTASTNSTSIKMADSELRITIAEADEKISLPSLSAGWLTVTPKIWGSIALKFSELAMPNPDIEASIDEVELRGLGVSVKAQNLQLAPIDGETASIDAIELTGPAVASVPVHPPFTSDRRFAIS